MNEPLTERKECRGPWNPDEVIATLHDDGTLTIDAETLNPGKARWLACWILGVTHPIMDEWLRRNRNRST